MLHNLTELYGSTLAARDGDIGHVKDFYFDDKTWGVRYVVANTGTLLTGRLVLIAPHALGRFDQDGKTLHVHLTRTQIENSPSIESHRPVSRQDEAEYFRYYGWPVYWIGDGFGGFGGSPGIVPVPSADARSHHGHNQRDDIHLRSTQAVTGYHIEATDGAIGTVSGFIVDEKGWAIRELVAETGHWYSGKEILISPSKIERISYEESKVFVSLTKADIERTAENDVAKAGV